MPWTQAKLQQLINDEIEENLNLDYKAAAALKKTDGKRKEVTKDVSALANSNGGVIIYGIKEYNAPDKRHLPEKIDPVDRTAFSKEWLEQVASNIRPRISDLVIHPVDLNTGPNDVAYVVEVPESDTAHQAADHRYYKRYNFESVAMEDYEIRLVMGRAASPALQMTASIERVNPTTDKNVITILISLENTGKAVAKAPYLATSVPPRCSWDPYGLGGNHEPGSLPQIQHYRMAQEGRFGGTTDAIIYPGVVLEVALLNLVLLESADKVDDLVFSYQVAAENMRLKQDSFTISGDEILERIVRRRNRG